MGQFQTQAVQLRSPINQLTKDIRANELTFKDWGRAVRRSGQIAQQQMRIREAMFMQFRQSAMGDPSGEMIIPQDALRRIGQARMQLSTMAQATRSAAHNLVNLGKNVQWAGRQLTVGLTVPLSIIGGFAQSMAREVDEQLIRLQKVYETTSDNAQQELQDLADTTVETSREMAEAFGIAQTETLQTAADFAVLGYQGEQLQGQVREASRLQRLAAVEQADAIDLTRSTQAVWRLETEELTQTFNKFNLIENQTALQVKELADSLPEVAGTLRTLNLSAEEGAAMMAAMKEQGVGANEAAHALKFGLSRVVNATPAATERFRELGVELDGIFERHGGNMMAVMEEISSALSQMESGGQRLAALTELVGRRQADRLIKLTDSIGAFAEGNMEAAGAFATSMEIIEMSSEEAAEKAKHELETIYESASGTFDRLKAQIGVEMAEIGKSLLEPINTLLKGVLAVLKWYNQLEGTIQGIVRWGLVFAGLVGPVVMLTGLMANFIGQIVKFGAWIAILLLKMPLLTAEQRLMALMAKDNAMTFAHLGDQTRLYANSLDQAVAASRRFQGAQAGMAATVGAAGSSGVQFAGRNLVGTGMAPGVRAQSGITKRTKELQKQGQVVSDNTKKVKLQNRAWGNGLFRIGAISLALPAVNMLLTEMTDGTSAWVRILTSALTILLLMPGALTKIVAGIKAAGAAVRTWSIAMAATAQSTGKLAALATGLKGIFAKVALGAVAVKAAILAIPAAIIGGILHARKLRDTIGEVSERANTAADALSNATEGMFQAPEEQMSEVERQKQARIEAIEKVREEEEEMMKDIRELRTEEAQREYITAMAWQLERKGHSPEEIQEQVRLAFEAANVGLQVSVEPIIDEASADELQRQLDEAVSSMNVSEETWLERINPFDKSHVADKGIGSAREYGKNLASAISQGIREEEMDMDILERTTEEFNIDRIQSEIDRVKNEMREMSSLNLIGQAGAAKEYKELKDELNAVTVAREESLVALAKELNLDEDLIDSNSTLGTIMRELGSRGVPQLEDATKAYNREIARRLFRGDKLTDQLKDEIYYKHLLANGFNEAEAAAEAFGDEADETAGDLENLGEATEEAKNKVSGWVNTVQSSISSQLNDVVKSALDAFDATTKAREDAFSKQIEQTKDTMEAEREARLDAFDEMKEDRLESIDNEIESLEDRTDRAIEANDREIEALEEKTETEIERSKDALEAFEESHEDRIDKIKQEQDADDERERNRERMFRREQQRLRHEASMRQQGISARMAELRGDLEQSAIIRDQMRQEEVNRAIDLANEEAQDAAEKRKKQRDNRIEQLEHEMEVERNAHEERKEMLEDELEARRKSLEEQNKMLESRLERERDALKERKEMLNERLSDERDQLQKSLKQNIEVEVQRLENAKESYKNQREDHRKMLDNKLQDQKEFVPRSEAQYRDEWIPAIDKILREHGESIQKADEEYIGNINEAWTTAVDKAQKKIAEEQSWVKFGEEVGNAVADGLSGGTLKLSEIIGYIKTGNFPGGQQGGGGMQSAWNVMHTGGFVGGPAKQRRGTADKLRHDEVGLVGQKGEYMVDKNTVSKYGVGFFRSLQNSKESPTEQGNGSRFHEGGLITDMLGALTVGMGARMGQDFLQKGFMQRQAESLFGGGFGGMFGGGALEAFAAAIRKLESGGNYGAIGPRHPRMGRALGAYQIMESNWPIWAREAGIPGANWRDRSNQDQVAMHKFQQYFNQFKDWAAVAVSWFAGPGRARQYMQDPSSVGGISDVLGTSVSQYVQRIMQTMQQLMAAQPAMGGGGSTAGDLIPPDHDRTRGAWQYYGGWKHNLRPYVIQDTIRALNSLPGGQYITSAYRSPAHNRAVGGAKNSDHMKGKGLDIGGGSLEAIGNAFRGNPRIRWISPLGMYGGHRHISWRHEGGPIDNIPQLRNGGEARFDNTLANLHRGETVLTSPLTDAFKQNVFEGNGAPQYNINVYAYGSDTDPDMIARKVENRLQRKEINRGKSRRV